MNVEKLSLINFKNYLEITLDFSAQINCIVGSNGAGKTNLLDAIHYLSLTKSAFNSVDAQNIMFEQDFFMIKGIIERDGKKEVLCSVRRGKKKTFKVNKSEYEKLSHHLGRYPVVLVAPDDSEMIKGSSELRRKFFDSIICQLDIDYLKSLVRYNHFLKQRNALLKKFKEGLSFDADLLLPYDQELIELNTLIHQTRSDFMVGFNETFNRAYKSLSMEKENMGIAYESLVRQDLRQLFDNALDKDKALERTTVGIHRDDFKFLIDNRPVKKFGSQGQQKSFLLALKMAHYQSVRDSKGFSPILMLDDVFDKLDMERISRLLQIISKDDFGQIFITDARAERTIQLLKELNLTASFYFIESGMLSNKSVAV
ncbi:MAG: DNA replication and repair protein RecF [Bacteroidota bacterium]